MIPVFYADGLIVEKSNYYDGILNEFKDLIKAKFNINVNFSEKKMTQDYLDILNDKLDFKFYNYVITTGLLSNYFKNFIF